MNEWAIKYLFRPRKLYVDVCSSRLSKDFHTFIFNWKEEMCVFSIICLIICYNVLYLKEDFECINTVCTSVIIHQNIH